MISYAGHVATIGEMRDVYKILVGKSESKRAIGRFRPMRRWDNECYLRVRIGLVWPRLGISGALMWRF
jgi:hypothetical protein